MITRIFCCLISMFVLCARPLAAEEFQPWYVGDIECTPSGVWCATSDGLFRFQFPAGVCTRYTPLEYGAEYASVRHITLASDGSLWITIGDTEADFIMRFADESWAIIDAATMDFSSFPLNMREIVFQGDEPWFSTYGELYQYHDEMWTRYTKYLWGGHSCTPIRDFAFDQDGIAWAVGCVGLSRIVPGDTTMVEDSRFRGQGNKILIDDDGVFWIGSSPGWYPDANVGYYGPGGLTVIDGDSVISYTTENSEIPSNHVLNFAFDSKGVLWLCVGSGVASFEVSHGHPMARKISGH